MDLGIKPKDVDYYARIDDRAARSKAAMENLGKDIFGRPASDDKPSAPAAPAAPKPPAKVAKAPEVPKPPKGTASELQRQSQKKKKIVGKAGTARLRCGEPDTEAAAIEATAEGDAEKKVADTARKGRRSLLKQLAKGLLSSAPVHHADLL